MEVVQAVQIGLAYEPQPDPLPLKHRRPLSVEYSTDPVPHWQRLLRIPERILCSPLSAPMLPPRLFGTGQTAPPDHPDRNHRMRTPVIGVAAALSLFALAATVMPLSASAQPTEAPDSTVGKYIVETNSVSAAGGVAAGVRKAGGEIENVYSRALTGFAARMTADQANDLQVRRSRSVRDGRRGLPQHHRAGEAHLGPRPDRPAGHGRQPRVPLRHDRRRRDGLRRRHRHPAHPQAVRQTRQERIRLRGFTTRTRRIARAMARTSPARSAAPPTGRRRVSSWSPFAFWIVRVRAGPATSSMGWTGSSPTRPVRQW